MLLTVSNLFPRPDRPRRGLFNLHLFRALAEALSVSRTAPESSAGMDSSASPLTLSSSPLLNICLVPDWRWWRWPVIRSWDGFIPEGPAQPLPFETRYHPVWYAPVVGRDWNWLAYARSLRSLSNAVRWRKAVLATWLYPDGVAVARIAGELGIPCWIMVQGSDTFHLRHPRRREAILRAAATVEGFFCVNQPLADTLTDAGILARKIHVTPNGVDTGLFRHRTRAEAAMELVRGGGGALYGSDLTDLSVRFALFVGNLVPVKGPDILLDAWARMLGSDRAAGVRRVLVVLGDGPLRPQLARQAYRLGIAGTVRFLGSRPQSEVALWMNAADVLCLPSRSEGMPNVALEALVSGLPLVVADVGNCRDIVADEPGARLVVPGDVQGFAAGLSELLAPRMDRQALMDRHRNKYSWKRQAESMINAMPDLRPPRAKDE